MPIIRWAKGAENPDTNTMILLKCLLVVMSRVNLSELCTSPCLRHLHSHQLSIICAVTFVSVAEPNETFSPLNVLAGCWGVRYAHLRVIMEITLQTVSQMIGCLPIGVAGNR